ncbi:hypothetical protein AYO44_10345 [Planctomycetaceae bacterium SCGC AG-212-F19]|nr:hypothetical protein AYO44_10345 [Planctomycetaceae bacterium SCGC AG-212-F19]
MALPATRNSNHSIIIGKQLVVIKGAKADNGRVYPLPDRGAFTIGRSQKTDTHLLDPKVSRNHCEIDVRDGRVLLREAPRTPGSDAGPVVLVNGAAVKERSLHPGDVIRIGDTELRFDDADPYEAATVGGAVLQAALGSAAPELASLLEKAAGRDKPASAPAKPRTPSPYEILDEIGRGESAVVYRAHDLALKQNVAIKELADAVRNDSTQAKLHFEEAAFLAGREHEHIVKVHGVDRDRGWIIMELLPASVAQKLAGGPLPQGLVRSVMRQALAGLDFLHQHHKLHGAIKPANLLIDAQGRVKLGDAPGLTLEGEVQKPRGNMKYVAPEMLNPEFGAIGAGVDLYCLGFTALEMLAGPGFDARFKGVGEGAIDPELAWLRLHGSRSEPMPRATEIVPDLPADLAQVIDRLLAREVSQRYASAAETLRDLPDAPLELFEEAKPAPVNGWNKGNAQESPSWFNRQMANPWVAGPALAFVSFLVFYILMWDPAKKSKAPPTLIANTPQYALVVGVDDCKGLPRFRHAEADVLELARVLGVCGYKPAQIVTLTQNLGAIDPSKHMPTAANIRRELQALTEQRKPQDGLLLALAGPVVQFPGESECYFCPSDARLEDKTTLLPLSEIYQVLEKWPSECNLVLIDGSRHVSPGATDVPAPAVQLVLPQPHGLTPPQGTPVYFSCGAGKLGYSHLDSRNGVFFHYVIKALQGYRAEDFTRKTTVEQLERYVSAEVYNYVSKTYGDIQRPVLVGQVHARTVVADYGTRMSMCVDGFKHAAKRRYPEAVYYCGTMLNEQEYVEAYIVRGMSKLYDDKATEALADFARAIELAPTNATAYGHRAEAHLALGDRTKALADVEKAIQLDPLYGPFYAVRGRVSMAGQQSDAADADLEKAMRLNPNRPNIHIHRGLAYLAINELDKARAEFTTATQLAPADPLPWLNRGRVLEAEHNDMQAVDEYSRAIAVAPEYAPAYLNRIAAYDRLARDAVDADVKKAYQEKAKADREKLRANGVTPVPASE